MALAENSGDAKVTRAMKPTKQRKKSEYDAKKQWKYSTLFTYGDFSGRRRRLRRNGSNRSDGTRFVVVVVLKE